MRLSVLLVCVSFTFVQCVLTNHHYDNIQTLTGQIKVHYLPERDITPSSPEREKIPEETLKTLVLTLATLIYQNLPDTYDLPNVTYPLPVSGNICLNLGKASGFKDFTDPVVKINNDEQNNIKISVEMKLGKLSIVYKDVYMSYYGQKYKRGQAKLSFSAKLIGGAMATSSAYLSSTVMQNECPFYLNTITISGLSDIQVDIYSAIAKQSSGISTLVDLITTSTKELILTELVKMIRKGLWHALPDSMATICRDPKLIDQYAPPIQEGPKRTESLIDDDRYMLRNGKYIPFIKPGSLTPVIEVIDVDATPIEGSVEHLDSLFNSKVWTGKSV